eukprot:3557767-Pleurochrysis_carterae.AAC.1
MDKKNSTPSGSSYAGRHLGSTNPHFTLPVTLTVTYRVHIECVELLGLELETLEVLVRELGLVARRPLELLIAMFARKSRTRAAVVAAELEEANA